jgi:hypothetical protein
MDKLNSTTENNNTAPTMQTSAETSCFGNFECKCKSFFLKIKGAFIRKNAPSVFAPQSTSPVVPLVPGISFSDLIADIDRSHRFSVIASEKTVKIRQNFITLKNLHETRDLVPNQDLLDEFDTDYSASFPLHKILFARCMRQLLLNATPVPDVINSVVPQSAYFVPRCVFTRPYFDGVEYVFEIASIHSGAISLMTSSDIYSFAFMNHYMNVESVMNEMVIWTNSYVFQLDRLYTPISMRDIISLSFVERLPNAIVLPQFLPQSSEFVPKITQRYVRQAPQARKSDGKLPPCSRLPNHLAARKAKELTLLRTAERDSKYLPQMFSSFIPKIPVDIHVQMDDISTLLKEGVNVNHKLDPEILQSISQIKDLLVSSSMTGTSVLNTTHILSLDPHILKNLTIMVTILASALYHHHSPSNVSLGFLLSSFAAGIITSALPLDFDVFGMFASLTEYVKEYTTVSPQMSSSTLSTIISGLTTILIAILSGSTGNKPWTKTIIEQLFSFKRNSESLESCVVGIISIVESIVNYIRRDVLGLSSLVFLETDRTDINDFVKRAVKLQDDVHFNKFLFNTENAHYVHTLWL